MGRHPALPPSGPRVELLHARHGQTPEQLVGLARMRAGAHAGGRHVSRSYAFPYALLATHAHAVGVGLERVIPRDVVFAASICTPAELEAARILDWAQMTSLWASKVAFAKARGDARLYDPRRLDGPAGWTRGVSGPWRAQALAAGPDHRAWVCWRE
jgi:hypothetical protein